MFSSKPCRTTARKARYCFRAALIQLCLLGQSACSEHWPKVHFKNRSPVELKLLWKAGDNDFREVGRIATKSTVSQDTFVMHRFRVVPTKEKQAKFVDVLILGAGTVEIVMENEKLSANWLDLDEEPPKKKISEEDEELGDIKAEECVRNLEASSDDPYAVDEDEKNFCRRYPLRNFVISKSKMDWNKWTRKMKKPWGDLQYHTRTQPAALRNFTTSGYKLLRRHDDGGLPYGGFFDAAFTDSMDRLIQWYEKNRKDARPEEHGLYDPAMSSYESDTFVLTAPGSLSKPVLKSIKKGLENWAGLPDGSLLHSAFYGPRLYRNTSILRQHVDIWETHVLSAIVSVGKRGLVEPWPLEIISHDGSKHEVDDAAGDIIFYESASCAHAREGKRLNGREVANMFTHFVPRDWKPLDGSHLQSNAGKVNKHLTEL